LGNALSELSSFKSLHEHVLSTSLNIHCLILPWASEYEFSSTSCGLPTPWHASLLFQISDAGHCKECCSSWRDVTTQVAHTLHHTQLLTLNESQRHNVTSTYHDHCKDFVGVCSPIIPDADSHYKTMLCIARNTKCKSLKYSFPSPLNYEYLHNNQVQKRRKKPYCSLRIPQQFLLTRSPVSRPAV
jgi:hypothetical protein